LGDIESTAQALPPQFCDEVDMTNIEAFYRLEVDYINSTRDEILKKYGSVEDCLSKGLGLPPQELQQLRDRLLQSSTEWKSLGIHSHRGRLSLTLEESVAVVLCLLSRESERCESTEDVVCGWW
jgi:hypothetical protein